MKKISFEEVKSLAKRSKGYIDKIYLHWSAGRYTQTFDDYHINITGTGTIFVSTIDFTDVLAHTWRRNSRAIGITLCCAYNASPDKNGLATGEYPPTEQQVEVLSKVIAILANELGIEITAQNIMTHAEAADLDNYGPETTCERWDLWKLKDFDGIAKCGGDVLRGKAQWYKEQIK